MDEHIEFFVIFVQLKMSKKIMVRGNQNSAYKERNIEFLEEYAQRDGVKILFNGVMYREITKGQGRQTHSQGDDYGALYRKTHQR